MYPCSIEFNPSLYISVLSSTSKYSLRDAEWSAGKWQDRYYEHGLGNIIIRHRPVDILINTPSNIQGIHSWNILARKKRCYVVAPVCCTHVT